MEGKDRQVGPLHRSNANMMAFSMALLTLMLISPVAVKGELEEFGSIEEGGSMLLSRYNHTATLLEDGRVLVVGGTIDGRMSIGSCEIYDPDEDSWKAAANLEQKRMRHSAELLPSGKVLVSGGYVGTEEGHPSLLMDYNRTDAYSLSTTEIFDPLSDTWEAGPELGQIGFWQASQVLPDGRVLLMGGINEEVGAVAYCEIFDPDDNIWSDAAPMNIPRARAIVTLLDDGSVLVTGGHDAIDKVPFDSCERYYPDEDRWEVVSPMNRGRGYHSAVLLNDGQVLVSGGFSGLDLPDWQDGEIYDPVEDTWEMTSEMAFPRHNQLSVVLPGGQAVIMCGSNCATGMCHSGFEYYDPEIDAWKDTNLVVMGRKWATATELDNGKVLIVGGLSCNEPTANVEIFSPPDDIEEDLPIGFHMFLGAILITGSVIYIRRRR